MCGWIHKSYHLHGERMEKEREMGTQRKNELKKMMMRMVMIERKREEKEEEWLKD